MQPLTVVTKRYQIFFPPQGQMESDIIVDVLYYTPLHKRTGCCTSIPITGSDSSCTSQNQQQNSQKTILGVFSFENPATSLFLLRRKLKHKQHLKREFLDQVITDSLLQFLSETRGSPPFPLLPTTCRNRGRSKGK